MKKFKIIEEVTPAFGYGIYKRKWLFFWEPYDLWFSSTHDAEYECYLLNRGEEMKVKMAWDIGRQLHEAT